MEIFNKSTSAFFMLGLFFTMLLSSCAMDSGPGSHAEIDWVNFLQVGSITYYAHYSKGESPRTKADLGNVYTTVKFKVAGNVHIPSYQKKDGDAAYLEPGTQVFTVKGYKSSFLLAVTQSQGVVLYEAKQNPQAKYGRDLFDIQSRVSFISINSEQDGITELATIKDSRQVATLVDTILTAPVHQSDPPQSPGRYFLALHLVDSIVIVRQCWPDEQRLEGNITLPTSFWDMLEQALHPSGH